MDRYVPSSIFGLVYILLYGYSFETIRYISPAESRWRQSAPRAMPPIVRAQQYAQTVLEHVQNGVYPEDEEVISAELPSSALPTVSKLIDQAREELKVRLTSIEFGTVGCCH